MPGIFSLVPHWWRGAVSQKKKMHHKRYHHGTVKRPCKTRTSVLLRQDLDSISAAHWASTTAGAMYRKKPARGTDELCCNSWGTIPPQFVFLFFGTCCLRCCRGLKARRSLRIGKSVSLLALPRERFELGEILQFEACAARCMCAVCGQGHNRRLQDITELDSTPVFSWSLRSSI